MGNAYGVCVILVSFITTNMVALVAILVWRFPIYLVLPVYLFFVCLDGTFLSAVLIKVPQGAWFTLMLAFILSSIFTLWHYGKEAQWRAESLDHVPPCSIITSTRTPKDGDSSSGSGAPISLTPAFGGVPISTIPGLGIFFDKLGDPAVFPASFAHFVVKFATRPAVLIFFHMRPLPMPSVPPNERYVVTRAPGLASCYNVVLRHGYMDDLVRPSMARDIMGQIELAVSRPGISTESDAAIAAELAVLRTTYELQTVYVLGKEMMKIRSAEKGVGRIRGFVRGVLLSAFLYVRENTRTKLADLDLDHDKVIEVGFVKEI